MYDLEIIITMVLLVVMKRYVLISIYCID